MLRNLGALGDALKELGFNLIAPDGGHTMTHSNATEFVQLLSGPYKDKGLDVNEWFTDGKLWDADTYYDWLDSTTDEATGKKTYRAFDTSINSINTAASGHDVRGVLGFSQGCVWGAIVTALALKGELSFGNTLRFGVYMSGFLPTFDEPVKDLWPIECDFQSRFIIGDADPMFPDAKGTIESLAAQFPAQGREVIVVPGLSHQVTQDPALIQNLAYFAKSNM